MKLALVVGHEKERPGALGAAPLSQSEYDYNLEVAQFAYREARESGHDCHIFLRDGIGIEGAYRLVNEWSPDLAVELHFNACDRKASGTETLFANPAHREFAEIMQRELCSLFERKGKQDRGVKLLEAGDRGHRNMSLAVAPACLLEPFFGDNPFEAALGHKLRVAYAVAVVRVANRCRA